MCVSDLVSYQMMTERAGCMVHCCDTRSFLTLHLPSDLKDENSESYFCPAPDSFLEV